MGDIGDELAALGLRLREGLRHGVEGLGQFSHLVLPILIAGDPCIKLAVAELPGRLGDLLERAGLVEGGHRAADESDAQHAHRRKEEDRGHRPPQLRQAGAVGRHKDQMRLILLAQEVALHHCPARHIAPLGKQAAQIGQAAVAAILYQYFPADDAGHGGNPPPPPG